MNELLKLAATLFLVANCTTNSLHGMLAGGRPNAISGGHNAFAGIVNPANAVWIEDRFDFGLFLVHQKVILNNKDDNPLFPPGKINQTYKAEFLHTPDAAIHKRTTIKNHDFSVSLATYTTPGYVKVRTKLPFPITGTTPIRVDSKTQVVSAIFSLKIHKQHSIGVSFEYFSLSHRRNGFQRTDNALRSVSPGHVTNNGTDYSNGFGLSLGWTWNISKALTFGLAYVKKSPVGQFRKYRGYEPHHAKNYIPQTIGAGFTYRFNKQLAGRLEVLWTNYGNLPNANNTLLSNGKINRNKRGSNRSPGSGLQDATIINLGLGYRFSKQLSIGGGITHRIKLSRKSKYIISHSYMRQTVYDVATLGINFKIQKHDFFLAYSHGIVNQQSGYMPEEIGGGKFISKKYFDSLSISWGYLY